MVLIAGIGDLVMASPSLRAMRNGYPDAHIHLLTSTDSLPIAIHYPTIDEVTAFPIRELRESKKGLLQVPALLQQLRRRRYQLALNLYPFASWTGSLKMGMLLRLAGAQDRVGHASHRFGTGLTRRIPDSIFSGSHLVDAMLKIASSAGGVPDPFGPEVFWDTNANRRWDRFMAPFAKKIILGLNPGGDRERKRWRPERFAAVAEALAARFPTQIILLGGPSDVSLAATIEHRLPAHCAVSNLAGKVPLAELACLIQRLDLLLTNDSGPMHIAAAVKTPLVALFGPGAPHIYGPYTEAERYRVIQKDVDCERPCEITSCPHRSCLDGISVEEVTEACMEMLLSQGERRGPQCPGQTEMR